METAHERKLALDISSRVVNFLSTSLSAGSSNRVPNRVQSEHYAAPTSSGPRSVSFADMAKTLKNSGPDFRSAKTSSFSSPLSLHTNFPWSVRRPHSGPAAPLRSGRTEAFLI